MIYSHHVHLLFDRFFQHCKHASYHEIAKEYNIELIIYMILLNIFGISLAKTFKFP